MRKRPPSSAAFSLVELLVVVAIIAVLAVFVQAGVVPTLSAYRLSTGAQQVNDQLHHARQLAVSHNQYVQVRVFFPRSGPRAGQGTALAIYQADSPFYVAAEAEYATLEAAGRFRREGGIRRLPEGCAVVKSPSLSSLLDWLENDPLRDRTGSMSLGGELFDWIAFYFRPDGSLDLDGLALNAAYLAIVPTSALTGNSGVPDNYAAVSLNPVTGRIQVIRP